MRAFTAQETKVLALAGGYQVRTRVKIKNAGGTFVDYSSLEGTDWLVSADWDEDVDQPIAGATVELIREKYALSLAPLMGGKLATYVDVNREIKIETACVPIGNTPLSGDWLLSFHGYIDKLDSATSVMVLNCLDLGSELQATFIETERAYSDSTGVAVEDVMADILADNGLGGLDFYIPVSPGWNIKGFIQRQESLLDALTALAHQIGWDIKFKYDSGTAAYRLTLFLPDRTKAVADYTLAASRYLEVKALAVSRVDVRNAIQVGFYNRAVLDAAGNPTLTFTTTPAATPITMYGRRWMGITEAASSNIDTLTEANKMRDAALADLKDPVAIQEVELLMFPHLEPGDLLTFTANNKHYSSDQTLAVTKVSHNYTGGKTRTTVTVRGKPCGPRAAWFQMETRPGVAPPLRNLGPQAPTGTVATTVVGGAAIRFAPPVVGHWDMFELHVSTSTGFTPDNTVPSTTLKATSTTDHFELSDLVPGTLYYYVVVPRDSFGNRGTPSAEVAIAAGYTTPSYLQPLVSFNSLVPNPDFEANNTVGAPPDAWSMLYGTWGTDVLLTGTAYSGNNALTFPAAGPSEVELESQFFVVTPGDIYSLTTWLKETVGAVFNHSVKLYFYDEDFIDVGGALPTGLVSGYTAGVFTECTNLKAAGATARFGRVRVRRAGAHATSVFACDSITVEHFSSVKVFAHYKITTGTAVLTAVQKIINFDTAVVASSDVATGASWKFTAPVPGRYAVHTGVGFPFVNANAYFTLEVFKNGTKVAILGILNAGAADQIISGGCTLELATSDYIDIRAYHQDGATRTCFTGTNGWITINRTG